MTFVAGVPSLFRAAFEVNQASGSLVMGAHVQGAKKAKGKRNYKRKEMRLSTG